MEVEAIRMYLLINLKIINLKGFALDLICPNSDGMNRDGLPPKVTHSVKTSVCSKNRI